MFGVGLPALGFVPVWRLAARRLASHGVAPEDVTWDRGASSSLFSARPLPTDDGPRPLTVPAAFLRLAETVLCHREPEAPQLCYQALLRHQSDRRALANPADPLTGRLETLARSVRRDIHKMHAFVRFRELPGDVPRRRFGAWFQPDHAILEAATPFFARRFGDMDWMIATPEGVARFDAGQLRLDPPALRPDLPEDASEALWAAYFANIFNPSRIKIGAMRSEMPLKYWKNLPETRLIPAMLQQADARVAAMRAALPSEPPARAARILDRLTPAPQPAIPETLQQARAAAARCRRCSLCEPATQTVWGQGDPDARLMLVGEQPGDEEDLQGRPFVGPAGRLLRAVMAEAQVGPVWMTNAVKHFKFQPRGKHRLHQPPNRAEIDHCRWWLRLERAFVAPRVTVALGASAAYSLTGSAAPLAARRGRIETADDGGPVLITWHPSFILRLRDPAHAAEARAALRDDLARAVAMSRALPAVTTAAMIAVTTVADATRMPDGSSSL